MSDIIITHPSEFKDQLLKCKGVRSILKRKYRDFEIEVLPDLFTGDPRFREFMIHLQSALNETFKGDRLAWTLDTSRMRAVGGTASRPIGHVILDNASLACAKTYIDARSRHVMRTVWRRVFCNPILGRVRVASKSSSGAPLNTYEVSEKLENIKRFLMMKNPARSVVTDPMRTLNEYEVACCFVRNQRNSPDKFGKRRQVASLDYAISGGREGELIDSSKNYSPDPRFERNRSRQVLGMNVAVNSLSGIVWAAFERNYLVRLGKTFSHHGPDDIENKLNKLASEKIVNLNNYLCIDCSNFDVNVPGFLIDDLYDEIYRSGYISEDMLTLFKAMDRSPIIEPDDGLGAISVIGADVTSSLNGGRPGITSGNRAVSSLGKGIMVALILEAYFSLPALRDVEVTDELIEDILTWRSNPLIKGRQLYILNQGDDNIIFFENGISGETLLDQFNGRYMKAESDVPRFLGMCLDVAQDGKTVKVINRLDSFIANTFQAERAWTSKLRTRWDIGVVDRYVLYGAHPYWHEFISTLDEQFELYYGKTFSAFIDLAIRLHGPKDGLSADNWVDSEFLRNPEAIHYKINADEVSPELLNEYYRGIEVDDYIHLLDSGLIIGTVEDEYSEKGNKYE